MKSEDITNEIKYAINNTDEKEDIPCKPETIARLFGVSLRRIQQLRQDGILLTTETKVGGRKVKRYMLADTVNRYITYLKEKKGQNRSERLLELKEQKLAAEVGLKELQGELHSIKRDIEIGKYIDVEQVELDYMTFFVVFKKFALSIPSRVVGQLQGSLDPLETRALEKRLNDDIVELLHDFTVAGKCAEDK